MNENISKQDGFDIVPQNEGILFVEHSKKGRSGHLGHGLVEYEDGKILAFYPNCSDDSKGHSGVGWMEFKRSEDGGKTWSEPHVFDYSKKTFDEGKGVSVMSEKAVLAKDGAIVLFNLVCDISETPRWEPNLVPTYIKSYDGGHTWTEAKELSDKPGRVYDAIIHEGNIYALQFHNDCSVHFTGNTEEHTYGLYVSKDNGETFEMVSELPFNTKSRGYGALQVLKDGSIIAYVYNRNDENHLDYVISKDNGCTWSGVNRSFVEKKIRNPQTVSIGDYFFLHGRSGHFGDNSGNFVLYSSKDGINWDSGRYLKMQEAGHGSYSNNLVVGKFDDSKPNRLLIQASHAYKQHRTNIYHWWIQNIRGTF